MEHVWERSHFAAFNAESYWKAIRGPQASLWRHAMKNEFNLLKSREVWTKVDLRQQNIFPNIIDAHWEYSVDSHPQDDDTFLNIFHAKLVVAGGQQKQGIDFTETYSPTPSYASVRMMLSLAMSRGYHINHLVFDRALLNADIDSDVYVRAPLGLAKHYKGAIFKLNKAMDGLKQGHRVWHQYLDRILRDINFQPSEHEPCLYVYDRYSKYYRTKIHCMVLVYVDHMVVAGNHPDFISDVRDDLYRYCDLQEYGRPSELLGMRVSYNDQMRTCYLDCETKINEIADLFQITKQERNVKTPMQSNLKFQPSPISTEGYYRILLGKLQFIARATRPDIAFAVNRLSSFSNEPTTAHYHALRRVAGYLVATKTHKLALGGFPVNNAKPQVIVHIGTSTYSNTDAQDTKQVYGRIVRLGDKGPVIDWDVHQDHLKPRGYPVAQLMCMGEAYDKAHSLKCVLADTKCPMNSKIKMTGDCQVVLQTSFYQESGQVQHTRAMIELRVFEEKLVLQNARLLELSADILTESLDQKSFIYAREALGLTGF